MSKIGIYQIRNLTTNKFYIGSAVNISKRFTQHRDDLRKNRHDNKYLQNAWNKYGEADFSFDVLEIAAKDDLLRLEQAWFDWTDCCNRNKGYNINSNAFSNLGIKFSDEARLNMSEGQKRNLNIEHLTRISKLAADAHRGKPKSEETKIKISNALKGRKFTAEHRANLSKALTEYCKNAPEPAS